MPLYSFRCVNHGIIDIYQTMDERHQANCPECGKEMQRLYTPSYIPSHPKIGQTRMELMDNLAKEGMANKEWRNYDSYYKTAIGATNGL